MTTRWLGRRASLYTELGSSSQIRFSCSARQDKVGQSNNAYRKSISAIIEDTNGYRLYLCFDKEDAQKIIECLTEAIRQYDSIGNDAEAASADCTVNAQ